MKTVATTNLFLHVILFSIVMPYNTAFGMQPSEITITIHNESESSVTIGSPEKHYCHERYYASHSYSTLESKKHRSFRCPKIQDNYAPLFLLYKQNLQSTSLEHIINPTTNSIIRIHQDSDKQLTHSIEHN